MGRATMRFVYLPLLAVSLPLISPTKPAIAQPDAAMQLCTPISTGDCAPLPQWRKPPEVKGSRSSAGDAIVVLNLVVSTEGSVHDVQVMNSPDTGLSDQAVASVNNWRFVPPNVGGRTVPVALRAYVQFHPAASPTVGLGPWRATWSSAEQLHALHIEAQQAVGQHNYQRAIALSRQVLALEPLYRGVRVTLADALIQLDEFAEAEAALQEEIKLDPKSQFAYNELGWTYQREREDEEAIKEYKKQIEVIPEAFPAHSNLGVLLETRFRCGEAMPELEKALSLSPGQARVMLARGKCDIDLGNTAKGISEMEDAANRTASSDSWNQAAYRLAVRNVDLDTAEKWAKRAISIESVFLQDLSLDHVTLTQMRLVNTISNYWDTLGWVYFRMGKLDRALSYVNAAWQMHPTPTKGNHLGQIYEKLGKRADAVRTYALAIASADLSKRGPSTPEDMEEARNRLRQLSTQPSDVSTQIESAQIALENLNSASVENVSNHTGDAEFIVKFAGGKVVDVRQMAGDASFAGFSEVVRSSSLSDAAPPEAGVEILRRGRLSCRSRTGACEFTLITTQQAVELATQEDPTNTGVAN